LHKPLIVRIRNPINPTANKNGFYLAVSYLILKAIFLLTHNCSCHGKRFGEQNVVPYIHVFHYQIVAKFTRNSLKMTRIYGRNTTSCE